MGESRGVCRILVEKAERRRPLERNRCGWENNIKMYLREFGWWGGEVDWIDLAQDRDRWCAVANMVMNLRVP